MYWQFHTLCLKELHTNRYFRHVFTKCQHINRFHFTIKQIPSLTGPLLRPMYHHINMKRSIDFVKQLIECCYFHAVNQNLPQNVVLHNVLR